MIQSLHHDVEVRQVMAPQVAGASDVDSDEFDLSGALEVTVLVSYGTITGGGTQKVQLLLSDAPGSGHATVTDQNGNTVEKASGNTSDRTTKLTLKKPGKRYGKVRVSRATQNAVINGAWVLIIRNRAPVTDAKVVDGGFFNYGK